MLDVNTGLFFKDSEGELRRARSAKSAARWGEVRWERGGGLVRGVTNAGGCQVPPALRGSRDPEGTVGLLCCHGSLRFS